MARLAAAAARFAGRALGRRAGPSAGAGGSVEATVEGCSKFATPLSATQAFQQGGRSHGRQGGSGGGSRQYGGAAVAAVAATAAVGTQLWPRQAECAAPPHPAASSFQPPVVHEQRHWLGLPTWLTRWLPGHRASSGSGSGATERMYLEAMETDPLVGVVMAFALPFLSLSFGYTPCQADMDAAAKLVEPFVEKLRPWEVAVMLWGAARLGYTPTPTILLKLRQRVAEALRGAPGSSDAFSPQEACMAAWALSALQAQTHELWAAELAFVAACPAGSMDEVALIHLWQAAMFADRDSITSLAHQAASLPRMRSASDEVRATLAAGGCPLPLITRCEQAYRAASRQAGFDGPYLIELTMLRLLVTIYQELGDSVAYVPFFEDLRLLDLQHARQLLDDPYLLAKFKSEIADKRARQNNFTRQLADVSRTLRDMGMYHVVQMPVEDDLVHVDIALPDYKIAFFLEAPSRAASGSNGGSGGMASLDSEGTMLSGYIANETPGTKRAKLRLLQQRGWVVLPLMWVENIRGEAEKRRLLLEQLDKAGQQQLMRGRVSSMLHGAMRTAEESKLGRERYGDRGSAGQYITRKQQQQEQQQK